MALHFYVRTRHKFTVWREFGTNRLFYFADTWDPSPAGRGESVGSLHTCTVETLKFQSYTTPYYGLVQETAQEYNNRR